MAGRKVRDAAEAVAMLEAVASSRRARADWAKDHGVDARSLNAWRLNLRRRASDPPELRLVELVPASVPVAPDAIVVRCGPFAVEVRGRFDDDALRRVLAVVAVVPSLGPTTRVFVARDPVDMRGSFDALAGRIRRLGLDPLDGCLYVFVSRRRHLLAVLAFDGSGWCLFRKRLTRGTFELPEVPPGALRVVVDGRVLAAMLTGIDLGAPRRRWYERPVAPAT